MNFKFTTVLITCLLTLQVVSQTANKDVLFTVDDNPVMASEFIRVYNKNLDLVKDESQKDIDNYLKLFIDYKLKLKEAEKLGLDQKPSYTRELNNYRKQLAKGYLTDKRVTHRLIQEAYDRLTQEVNAWHILVAIPENASPQDTLVAYQQIEKFRDRVLKEGFDALKNEIHNGKTIFAENLGYFSAFKMIYKFETVAYNTPVGTVSEPFRTRFGYHILKVLDKRTNRGQVEVGHIMVANKTQKDSLGENPEKRINAIYSKLQQGEDFESLAKQFSEDKSTAKIGGKLSPFSSGQLSSKAFEDAAFALQHPGDISKPVKTAYGWHIIKLYKKTPIAPFDELEPELRMKVKRDSRSKLIDEAFISKIKEKLGVVDNTKALEYFNGIITKDYYKRTWAVPQDLDDQILNQIGDETLSYKDFADYLYKNQRKQRHQEPLKQIVKEGYQTFLNREVLKYYDAHLENENQEFANIVHEYRDGLLLFDLMQSQIWDAARKDTTALQTYYKAHKAEYFLPKRVDAVVASSNSQKYLKKVAKLFEKGMTQDQIAAKLNKNGVVNVIFTAGVMDKTHQALPADFNFKTGISKIYKYNKSYIVANVKAILPKELLSFDAARGRVLADYQKQKETAWLQTLHNTYKVQVNKAVLETIKTKLNK